MDGADEGVYGWVAVNYLTGKLRLPGSQRRSGETALPDQATLGVLDLGGSSLEVTYQGTERKMDALAQQGMPPLGVMS
jgi:hypothetical protein